MNNAQKGDKILKYDNEQTAELKILQKDKLDYVGERIENVDLNDLTKGTYYAPTSTVKDTISNIPSDLPNAGFRVDMFTNGGNAYIQVLTSFSPSKPVTYTRAFNSGNFGEWTGDDSGETVDVPLINGFATYGGDGYIVRAKRRGNVVNIVGGVRPNSTSNASAISSNDGVVAFRIPENMRCENLVNTVHHGSAKNYWLSQINPNGNFSVSRYNGTASASDWLTFNVTYII